IAEGADGAVVEEKSAAAPAGNADFAASAGDGENGEMIVDSSAASEEDYTGTDLQVVGVDEGDRILTDGRYFYTLQGDGYDDECVFHIVSVDGKKTEEISRIAFPKFYFQNMYRFRQRIFLIGRLDDTTEESEDFYYDANPQTVVYVIDISDKEHPKKEYTRKQDGYYTNSRLTGGYLYLFSGYELPRYRLKDYKQSEPSGYVPSVDGEIIPENRLYAPAKKGDGSYTVMTSLDLNHPASFSDRAAIYGHYRNFYMSQEHFYIVQSTFTWLRHWFNYTEGAAEDTDTIDTEETDEEDSLITRFSYEDGKFLLKAKGKFSGETSGSYAFHEYKGNLCVVYTKYDEKTTNGLYVFDDSLEKIGEIGDLGVDEEIYASYYIDHMAYFVTYRNTDPVFAVDIENPRRPKLCSELKLPGYSDYLHSFGKEYMLGLGVHNDGENFEEERYKLSLFRIDEDQSLEETERKILPYKSWDYFLFNQDHREVFVDEERGLVGFYLHYEAYGNRFEYLLYRKNGDKLERIWKKTVDVKGKTYDLDELRGFRIGEIFYVVSGSGQVEVHPL
ncbi:MAG: beta-propeller domain-containing protein, partial [Lachnospiraceae bacterium]|nr:beta-propeller domain-containing protein [Lachnospiraceae bacterium]